MDKLTTSNGQLYFGSVVLGPSTGLYADRAELPSLTERDGVVHTTMPFRIDLVFVAGSNVVGVELKRGSDLQSSHDTRRLARQLVQMGHVCDIVLLGISGAEQVDIAVESDLVAYQMMGTIVVNLPSTPRLVVRTLAQVKPYLDHSRSVLRPFAWTDIDLKPRTSEPGWLLRAIPRVGPKLVQKLLDKFGSTAVALEASDEEWIELGANRAQLAARKEALS